AAARTTASFGFDTAESSAASSAACDHALSKFAIPGNGQNRKTSFFRLPQERMCALSCVSAMLSYSWLKIETVDSDTRILGLQTPTSVSGGTSHLERSVT